MKTTVEISDPLLSRVKVLAAKEGTTVRAMIEEGLRRVIEDRRQSRSRPFRLRDASVDGEGVKPPLTSERWSADRDFRRFHELSVTSPLAAP